MPDALTTIGRELSALSDEVLARVAALRPHFTYRVLRRCPVRSRASRAGDIIEHLSPTMDDGSPHLVLGHPMDGWVHVERGYVFSGNLRRVG